MLRNKICAGLCAAAVLSIPGWPPSASAATAASAPAARPTVIEFTGTSLAAALRDRRAITSPLMADAVKAFTALKSITGAPDLAISCHSNVSIRSNENGLFVSEEENYTNANAHMLRARATAIGPWEEFTVCRDLDTWYTDILSQEDYLYVSEEQLYTGQNQYELRASAQSTSDPSTAFYTAASPGCGCNVLLVSGENSNYVSEEQNYSGQSQFELRARASVAGPWESFRW